MASIYVNARFMNQTITGVQRYSWEITNRLQNKIHTIKPGKIFSGGAGHLWEQLILPGRLPKKSLLWSPAGAGPLLVAEQVVTIHDIAHLEYPEWFNSKFSMWYRWLLPRLTQRVRHILTVSEYSKDRIIEVLGILPEKISVVPCGIEESFFQVTSNDITDIRYKYGLQGDYILTVSSASPRKNFERMFRAWETICKKYQDVSLVVVGSQNLAFAANEKLGKLPERTIITGYVDNQDLPAFYAGARAFVYPSLYEGFGIPILEAMATGIPVVTSNTTSIPEVAGDAAVYVNPYEVNSIAEGLEKVLGSESLCKKLREKGWTRCKEFSWERSAKSVGEILSNHFLNEF
jgi:glycosyltransferase involved in cell wall biosynthesis